MSHVISSSYNHFIIMRTHRWPYGPCLFIFFFFFSSFSSSSSVDSSSSEGSPALELKGYSILCLSSSGILGFIISDSIWRMDYVSVRISSALLIQFGSRGSSLLSLTLFCAVGNILSSLSIFLPMPLIS